MSLKDVVARRKYNKQYYYDHPFSDEIKKNRQHKASLRRTKIREFINEYKSQLYCSTCGENRTACLDFHHPNDKDISIGDALRKGWSIKRIKSEMDKCIILCANCHRILHSENI